MPEGAVLDWLYCAAAVLGLIGGCAGNRFAWPLLGMFAFCQVVRWQGWTFDPELWGKVDSAVLVTIALILLAQKRGPDWRQWAVVGLFIPPVAIYAVQARWPFVAYIVSTLAAIAQLAVVFPWRAAWGRIRSMPSEPDRWNEFDLKVTA